MSDLNDFHYTDNVHDVLAVYVNRLMDSSLRSEYQNVEVLNADRELLDADTPIQLFDCGGADRDVLMPVPDAAENHLFMINNTSDGGEVIRLRDNDDTETIGLVEAGGKALLIPDGNGGYVLIWTGSMPWIDLVEQASAPASPASGVRRFFAMSDGFYEKDSAGTENGPLGAGGGGDKYPCEARLTYQTGVALPTSELTAKTTLYQTKFCGDQIAVCDGSGVWTTLTLGSDISLSLAAFGANKIIDIFDYNNSGALALDSSEWRGHGQAITGATNASPIVITATSHGLSNGDEVYMSAVLGNTAANGKYTVANVTTNTFELSGSTGNGTYTANTGWFTARKSTDLLTLQNGVLVLASNITRRYVGTIKTTSTAGQSEFSLTKRLLCNYYNRREYVMYKSVESSHSYASTASRYYNNDSTQVVEFVCGVEEDSLKMIIAGQWSNVTTGTETGYALIGLNGYLSNYSPYATLSINGRSSASVIGSGYGPGWHKLSMLESAVGTVTFDNYTISALLPM